MATNIETNIVVNDRIARSIEVKLNSMANASEHLTKNLGKLRNALSSLRADDIQKVVNAFNGLKNIKPFTSMLAELNQLDIATRKSIDIQQQLASVISRNASNYGNGASGMARMTRATMEQVKQDNVLMRSTANTEAAIARRAAAETRAAIATQKFQQEQSKKEATLLKTEYAIQNYTNKLNNLGNAALKAKNSFTQFGADTASFLSRLSGFAGLSFNIANLVGGIDTYQRISNKLQLTATSAGEVKLRFEQLTNAAIASYSSTESLTVLYTRLNLAYQQMGQGAEQAMRSTETLAKITSLAGLTTQEASSSLLQISQAFNKGKLDGDEFRNVMETMPLLADAIAKRLGVMRGELLELAPKGKITAKIMSEALEDVRSVVDNKFSKLIPTLSQGWQNFNTQLLKSVDTSVSLELVSKALGSALQFLGNNASTVLTILTSLGVFGAAKFITLAFNALKASQAVSGIVTAFRTATAATGLFAGSMTALNVVIRANPFGALLTGATLLIPVINELWAKFDNGKTLGDRLFGEDDKITPYMAKLDALNGKLNTLSTRDLVDRFKESEVAIKQSGEKVEELAGKVNKLRAEEQKLLDVRSSASRVVGYDAFTGQAITQQIDKTKELVRVQNELRDSSLDLTAASEENSNVMKSKLSLVLEARRRYEELKEKLKGSTDEVIRANPELRAMQDEFNALSGYIDGASGALLDFRRAAMSLKGSMFQPLVSSVADVINHVSKISMEDVIKKNFEKDFVGMKKKLTDLAYKESDAGKRDERRMKYAREIDPNFDSRNSDQQKIILGEVDRSGLMNEKKRGGGGRKGHKKGEKTDYQKALEEKERYLKRLDDEDKLLKTGLTNYTKYNELYALKIKLEQDGVIIGEEELKQLKKKIDANKDLREEMERIQKFKDDSKYQQDINFGKNINSFQKAYDNPENKMVQADKDNFAVNSMKDLGLDPTATLEYYRTLEDGYKTTLNRISALRDAHLITEQTAWAMQAQNFAMTQKAMLAPVQNSLSAIEGLQQSHNEKLARIGKAAAIANAIMNAYNAANGAYASVAAIPYVGAYIAPVVAAAALAAGMANVASIRGQNVGGFKSGGFTGFQGVNTVAGAVHGNEYVFDAQSTRNHGVENLEALRNGTAEIVRRDKASGTGITVNIENNGTNKTFEVQQIDEQTIRIICNDVINERKENIVKSFMKSQDGQEIIGKVARQNG